MTTHEKAQLDEIKSRIVDLERHSAEQRLLLMTDFKTEIAGLKNMLGRFLQQQNQLSQNPDNHVLISPIETPHSPGQHQQQSPDPSGKHGDMILLKPLEVGFSSDMETELTVESSDCSANTVSKFQPKVISIDFIDPFLSDISMKTIVENYAESENIAPSYVLDRVISFRTPAICENSQVMFSYSVMPCVPFKRQRLDGILPSDSFLCDLLDRLPPVPPDLLDIPGDSTNFVRDGLLGDVLSEEILESGFMESSFVRNEIFGLRTLPVFEKVSKVFSVLSENELIEKAPSWSPDVSGLITAGQLTAELRERDDEIYLSDKYDHWILEYNVSDMVTVSIEAYGLMDLRRFRLSKLAYKCRKIPQNVFKKLHCLPPAEPPDVIRYLIMGSEFHTESIELKLLNAKSVDEAMILKDEEHIHFGLTYMTHQLSYLWASSLSLISLGVLNVVLIPWNNSNLSYGLKHACVVMLGFENHSAVSASVLAAMEFDNEPKSSIKRISIESSAAQSCENIINCLSVACLAIPKSYVTITCNKDDIQSRSYYCLEPQCFGHQLSCLYLWLLTADICGLWNNVWDQLKKIQCESELGWVKLLPWPPDLGNIVYIVVNCNEVHTIAYQISVNLILCNEKMTSGSFKLIPIATDMVIERCCWEDKVNKEFANSVIIVSFVVGNEILVVSSIQTDVKLDIGEQWCILGYDEVFQVLFLMLLPFAGVDIILLSWMSKDIKLAPNWRDKPPHVFPDIIKLAASSQNISTTTIFYNGEKVHHYCYITKNIMLSLTRWLSVYVYSVLFKLVKCRAKFKMRANALVIHFEFVWQFTTLARPLITLWYLQLIKVEEDVFSEINLQPQIFTGYIMTNIYNQFHGCHFGVHDPDAYYILLLPSYVCRLSDIVADHVEECGSVVQFDLAATHAIFDYPSKLQYYQPNAFIAAAVNSLILVLLKIEADTMNEKKNKIDGFKVFSVIEDDLVGLTAPKDCCGTQRICTYLELEFISINNPAGWEGILCLMPIFSLPRPPESATP